MASKISIGTCLWLESKGEEAAELYVSLFENSQIKKRMVQDGKVLTVWLSLNGHDLMLLNGGPHFKLTEAASIMATCESQADVDRLWAKLTADGGQETRCGWLKDKFGVSWQIVPAAFLRMVTEGTPEQVQRTMAAMMQMGKLEVSVLQKAFEGR